MQLSDTDRSVDEKTGEVTVTILINDFLLSGVEKFVVINRGIAYDAVLEAREVDNARDN